jgi:hydrogenase/urease accessory protein HupE
MRHVPDIRRAAAGIALALPAAAFAHPGEHPGGFASLVHLLTEPDHLAMLIGAAALGYFIHRRIRHQRAERARRQHDQDTDGRS